MNRWARRMLATVAALLMGNVFVPSVHAWYPGVIGPYANRGHMPFLPGMPGLFPYGGGGFYGSNYYGGGFFGGGFPYGGFYGSNYYGGGFYGGGFPIYGGFYGTPYLNNGFYANSFMGVPYYAPGMFGPQYPQPPAPFPGAMAEARQGELMPAPRSTPAPRAGVGENLRVPADAVVWINDVKMKQAGPVRHFVSPPLDFGATYSYSLLIVWTANGKEVRHEQNVQLRAGQRTGILVMPKTPEKAVPAPEVGRAALTEKR